MSLGAAFNIADRVTKWIDPFLSPTQRNARAIEYWNRERRRLVQLKNPPKDILDRLHECDRNIFRLSAEKERLSKG